MVQTPPDPFNRAAFFSYIDSNPTDKMSINGLTHENVFWSQWLLEMGLSGERPRPGRLHRGLGAAIEIGGAATATIGLLGLFSSSIGTIMTISGFGFFASGYLVEKIGKSKIDHVNDALELVQIRQKMILSQLKQR